MIIEAKQFTMKMWQASGGKELGVIWRHGGPESYPVMTASTTGEIFDLRINVGDWIIFPKDDPSYPVHREQFEKEYLPVEEA